MKQADSAIRVRLEVEKGTAESTLRSFGADIRKSAESAGAGMKGLGDDVEQSVERGRGKIIDFEEAAKRAGKNAGKSMAGFGREAEEATDKANDGAEQFKDTVEAISLSGLMASLAGLVGAGVVMHQLSTGMEEYNVALLKAQVATGGAMDETVRLGEVAEQVWSEGIGETIGEVTDAVVLASKKLKGANEDVLTAAAGSALSIQRVWGDDTQKVMNAAGTLIKQFGLDHQQAFDFITAGYQRGLDSSGDFLDSILEYSVQFSNSSATAGQFFSILETGLQSGVLGTDKAADMFKEFSIRITDGSKTTNESLGLLGLNAEAFTGQLANGSMTAAEAFEFIVNRLRGVDDLLVQSQAGAGLLGTQFEDLGNAAALAVDISATKMLELKGTSQDLKNQYGTLGQEVGQLTRILTGAGKDAFEGYAQAGAQALGDLNDDLLEHRDTLAGVMGAATELALVMGTGGLLYGALITYPVAVKTATALTYKFNASLYTAQVTAYATARGINAVKAALNLMFAAWAGWEVGQSLYENFETARLAGLALVDGLMSGWIELKYGWEKLTLGIESMWTESINEVKRLWAEFAVMTAEILDKLGMDDAAVQVKGYANSINYATDLTAVYNAAVDKLNTKKDKEIQTHKAIVEALRKEAMEYKKTTKAKKHYTQALGLKPKPAPLPGATPSADPAADATSEKLLQSRAAAYQRFYNSLDTMSQKTYDAMLEWYTEEYNALVKLTGDKEAAWALYAKNVEALNEKMHGKDSWDLDDSPAPVPDEKEVMRRQLEAWETYYDTHGQMHEQHLIHERQVMEREHQINLEVLGRQHADLLKAEQEYQLKMKNRRELDRSDDYALAGENIMRHVQQEAMTPGEMLENSALDGMEKFGSALGEWTSQTKSFKDAFGDMAISVVADLAKMIAKQMMYNMIIGAVRSFGGSFGGAGGGAAAGATQLSNGATINPSGTVIGMASGGLIAEHVVGVGLSSGRSYEFGEGGVPEAILPKKYWPGQQAGESSPPPPQEARVDAKHAESAPKAMPRPEVKVKVINVEDDSRLEDYINSGAADQVIINRMRRNKRDFKSALSIS